MWNSTFKEHLKASQPVQALICLGMHGGGRQRNVSGSAFLSLYLFLPAVCLVMQDKRWHKVAATLVFALIVYFINIAQGSLIYRRIGRKWCSLCLTMKSSIVCPPNMAIQSGSSTLVFAADFINSGWCKVGQYHRNLIELCLCASSTSPNCCCITRQLI